METLIVHPKNQEQLLAVESILKMLKIDFQKEQESFYDPEFVAKIKKSEQNFEDGNFTTIKVEDLWK